MSAEQSESILPEQVGGGSASVGEILRVARERRGESLADAAHALKLTSRQVEAMEAARFELLPGPAFVRGFVRNYARYLGIDPTGLMSSLDRDLAASVVELAPVSNADGVMPNGGESRSALVPAAMVASGLALAVLLGWYFDLFEAPAENRTERAAVGPDAHIVERPPFPEPAFAAVAPEVAGAPVSPAAELSPPAVDAPDPAELAVVPPVPPSAESVAPAPQAEAAVPVTGEQLRFRFRGESWVEVRDAAGRIVYSGVNGPDSTRTVQGRPPFSLVVGNARDVSVEYRGQDVDLLPHTRVSVARITLQ